ncbi:hypothetical protein EE612_041465 [Oryza sativa]|nr:hypothetical protein EE612_041465 [Oryza sativa]
MEMEIVDMIQVLGPHLVPACVCTQSISTSDWYYYCYCYCTSLEVPIFRCLVSSCVCVCSLLAQHSERVPSTYQSYISQDGLKFSLLVAKGMINTSSLEQLPDLDMVIMKLYACSFVLY